MLSSVRLFFLILIIAHATKPSRKCEDYLLSKAMTRYLWIYFGYSSKIGFLLLVNYILKI